MAVIIGYAWLQALPLLWGPERFRYEGERAHFQGAQSWARQQDILYIDRLPLPLPVAPPSPLVPLWEKYALFDLLRENAPHELENFAAEEAPSYRSALARFYAAKYAFLRKQYDRTLEYLSGLNPTEFSPLLRQDMQFMEGYAAYAIGDKGKAIARLRPLTEKLGPFHDAANYYLGLIYYERGDWRSAAGHLEAVQTRAPYAQEAPLWLAYSLGKIPDLPRLKEWGERWRRQNPPPAHADTLWAFIAITLAQAQQCKAAEEYAALVESDPLVRLHLGICAYNQNRDTLALRLWEPLLNRRDSLSTWARYGYASALARLRRKEEALSILSGLSPSPTAPIPQSLWLSAQLAWDLRLPESGRSALLAYLQYPHLPKRQEALRFIAEFYAAEGKYKEALHTLDTLSGNELDEPRQRFWLMAGLDAFAEKRYGDAESLFTRAVHARGPHAAVALFWQAEALYRQGELRSAIEAYGRFLRHPNHKSTPYTEEARLAIAWAFLQLGQGEEALRYSEALRREAKNPLHSYATFISAGAYYLRKRYTEALSLYQSLIGSSLPQAQVRYYLAQTYIRLERYSEAEAVLAELNPTLAGADLGLYLRAEICALWLNRPSCTKAAAEQLLHHFPNSPKAPLALARLGLAQAELGEREAAIASLQRTLSDYPASPEAAKMALDGLRSLLPTDEYDKIYQSFMRQLPAGSETRLSFERERLRQLAENERWSTLEAEAAKAAAQYPALSGEALAWRALAVENLGDTSRALQLYQELTLYPEQRARAWERLARLHVSRGALQQALSAQDSLMRYLPTTGYLRVQGLLMWADLASALGKSDSARMVLSELLSDTLLNAFSRQRLLLSIASLWEKSEKPDSAISALHRAVEIDKNLLAAEALYHQARIFYALKRHDQARQAIYRLRDEMPQYVEPRAQAYLILARIFIDENKRKSANQLLESLIENAPNESIRKEARILKESIPPAPPDSPPPNQPKPKPKKKSKKPD
ncbi:MAG: tetratricopeptide repeat protein [Bacteroidia bacterium]|nr:tetratricopeptide repeat protein [Bacteroidia bacterium]